MINLLTESNNWDKILSFIFNAFLFIFDVIWSTTASVVYWSEFLATDTEVSGSIPGTTRFSEWYSVWNGVHSASWGQLRSYLNKK